MATAGGRDAAGLTGLLLDEAWRFEFFQAVRVLQRRPGAGVPVGAGDDPDRERVRFRSEVSLAFPASSLAAVTPDPEREDVHDMTVRFLGVATPASFGSLPLPYAELIMTRDRERDPVLRDFLDLFNHRLVSLFYRAWEKYRYAVVYERRAPGESGLFERALLALMGMGTPGLTGRLSLDDRALLARAHALCRRGVSARGLADLVSDYFGVPARVRQFVPHWYTVEDEDRTSLGRRSTRLGTDTRLGARVPMAQSRFRVVLGPLDWAQLADFLPTGTAFRPLSELCAVAAGPEYDFEFQLVLAAGAAPGLCLGTDAGGAAPLLGWSTWLQAGRAAGDLDDVIIEGGDVGVDPPGAAPPG